MPLPFDNQLSKIADSMGIALYQRLSMQEASVFLRCQIEDLHKLVEQTKIEYIRVTDERIDFFGYQLLQYLLGSIQELTPTQPASSIDRIIRSKELQNLTGLSRTTLWRLERAGKFPDRVPLGPGSVGWKLSEVESWIKSR